MILCVWARFAMRLVDGEAGGSIDWCKEGGSARFYLNLSEIMFRLSATPKRLAL